MALKRDECYHAITVFTIWGGKILPATGKLYLDVNTFTFLFRGPGRLFFFLFLFLVALLDLLYYTRFGKNIPRADASNPCNPV